MRYNPDVHHRRSIRHPTHDYRSPGCYFVTLRAWQGVCNLSEIVHGKVRLRPWGQIIEEEWLSLGHRWKHVVVDRHVVMPNHFHGILVINGGERTEIHETALPPGQSRGSPPHGPRPGSLGTLIGGFKSGSTRKINGLRRSPGTPVWQRGFFDRILRSPAERARARSYISANPKNWAIDDEYPLADVGDPWRGAPGTAYDP